MTDGGGQHRPADAGASVAPDVSDELAWERRSRVTPLASAVDTNPRGGTDPTDPEVPDAKRRRARRRRRSVVLGALAVSILAGIAIVLILRTGQQVKVSSLASRDESTKLPTQPVTARSAAGAAAPSAPANAPAGRTVDPIRRPPSDGTDKTKGPAPARDIYRTPGF